MNTPVSRKGKNETSNAVVFVVVLRLSRSFSMVRYFFRHFITKILGENTLLSSARDLMRCGEISFDCNIPSSAVAS